MRRQGVFGRARGVEIGHQKPVTLVLSVNPKGKEGNWMTVMVQLAVWLVIVVLILIFLVLFLLTERNIDSLLFIFLVLLAGINIFL